MTMKSDFFDEVLLLSSIILSQTTTNHNNCTFTIRTVACMNLSLTVVQLYQLRL